MKEFEALKIRLMKFMMEEIYPNEKKFQHQCEHQSGNEWVRLFLLPSIYYI